MHWKLTAVDGVCLCARFTAEENTVTLCLCPDACWISERTFFFKHIQYNGGKNGSKQMWHTSKKAEREFLLSLKKKNPPKLSHLPFQMGLNCWYRPRPACGLCRRRCSRSPQRDHVTQVGDVEGQMSEHHTCLSHEPTQGLLGTMTHPAGHRGGDWQGWYLSICLR